MTGELRFDERVVLVTGAGRGLGRAHALLLAERGARVMVSDSGTGLFGAGTDSEQARRTVADIRAAGGTAAYYLGDLTEEAGACGAVDATVAEFGRIDGLVHNAGFTLGGRDFGSESPDRLHALLAISAVAGFTLARQAWPVMAARGFGRILLTTSTAFYGMARSVPYATAKASLIGLTRALADAGTDCGITVNAIAPAGATRMAENLAESPFRDWFLATMRPELVAPVVAVLLHERCTVSGEIFVAGGGRVARTVLAETGGYVSAALTPEDMLAHLPGVLAGTDYTCPRSMAESGAIAARLLGSELAGPVTVAAGQPRRRQRQQGE